MESYRFAHVPKNSSSSSHVFCRCITVGQIVTITNGFCQHRDSVSAPVILQRKCTSSPRLLCFHCTKSTTGQEWPIRKNRLLINFHHLRVCLVNVVHHWWLYFVRVPHKASHLHQNTPLNLPRRALVLKQQNLPGGAGPVEDGCEVWWDLQWPKPPGRTNQVQVWPKNSNLTEAQWTALEAFSKRIRDEVHLFNRIAKINK